MGTHTEEASHKVNRETCSPNNPLIPNPQWVAVMPIGKISNPRMIGLDDATRQLACKLIPLLSLREGEHAKVSSYSDAFPGVDADEVFPGIIIGNGTSATSPSFLQDRKITHVLNAAEGSKALGIKFLGLKLPDTPQSNIGRYFPMVANFIEEALEEGGVVLVNCLMGVSRSATCVLAFLCLRRGMSIEQAVTTMRIERKDR